MRLPNDVHRCAGELIGDGWGHPDKVCERREICKRHVQFLLDHNTKVERILHTGWMCADDFENFIPVEEQRELFSD